MYPRCLRPVWNYLTNIRKQLTLCSKELGTEGLLAGLILDQPWMGECVGVSIWISHQTSKIDVQYLAYGDQQLHQLPS